MSIFLVRFFVITALTVTIVSVEKTRGRDRGCEATLAYFKTGSVQFATSALTLKESIEKLSQTEPGSLAAVKQSLKDCRLHYKKIEFFIAYFFKDVSSAFNNPPVTEIEETDLEVKDPTGFQVIESLLFKKGVWVKKQDLLKQAEVIYSTAGDMTSLLYQLRITDEQVMESLRLEVIRIMTLGITGYDAPELKTGIGETTIALQAIAEILKPYGAKRDQWTDSVYFFLETGIRLSKQNPDFASFDRLQFMTASLLPLQYYLGLWIKSQGLYLNTIANLNYNARNLYRPDAINLAAFPGADSIRNKDIITLGRKLFFEKALSGNHLRSCATCHQPQKYFTDGLANSIPFNGHGAVLRNAPSLFYTGFQFVQFWDGRAVSLEQQVTAVLQNPAEMNAGNEVVIQELNGSLQYNNVIRKLFFIKNDSSITIKHIAKAISSYVRSLNPMDSPFDLYLNGKQTALREGQKRGFNLFMGKARCGTCHFAPFFSGLRPPFYNNTELEVLGIPANADFSRPHPDKDKGRFAFFPHSLNDGAFKTPSLRNAAVTAPYMHNGKFKTLEEVLLFYNQGGGKGMGLNHPNQTLSEKPLQLSKKETADIIMFLQALTDRRHD